MLAYKVKPIAHILLPVEDVPIYDITHTIDGDTSNILEYASNKYIANDSYNNIIGDGINNYVKCELSFYLNALYPNTTFDILFDIYDKANINVKNNYIVIIPNINSSKLCARIDMLTKYYNDITLLYPFVHTSGDITCYLVLHNGNTQHKLKDDEPDVISNVNGICKFYQMIYASIMCTPSIAFIDEYLNLFLH